MGHLQNCVGVVLLLICSTNASPMEDNSTNIQSTDLDRRLALEAFMRISPYPRCECIEIASPTKNFNANEIMDMLLEYMRNLLKEKNMDRVEIPRFEETFTKRVGFIKLKGTFKGDDGWLESTSSIARKGDATVRLDNSSVTLESTLGLNVLRLGMEYTARLQFIKVKGKLRADVHSNAVSFSGGVEYIAGKCRFYLKTLELTELGKIEIHVTGLGKLNWLYSKIVTWVTDRLHKKIKETVENKMREIIEKELGKQPCPAPF